MVDESVNSRSVIALSLKLDFHKHCPASCYFRFCRAYGLFLITSIINLHMHMSGHFLLCHLMSGLTGFHIELGLFMTIDRDRSLPRYILQTKSFIIIIKIKFNVVYTRHYKSNDISNLIYCSVQKVWWSSFNKQWLLMLTLLIL